MVDNEAERNAQIQEDIAIAIAKGDINALTAAAAEAADLDDEVAGKKPPKKGKGLER